MRLSLVVVGAVCLGLSACASPNAGNPDGDAYAGGSQSVYDVAANPPRTNGTVRYDPDAPLPPQDTPSVGTSGAALSAPVPAPSSRMPPR
jgi:hypothetical protein